MNNEEIKEILSRMLHIIINYSDDFDDLEENEIRYQLPYKQMEKLYDYITNLQEENERLKKENIKLYKKDTKIINELKEELKITQEKWDKDKQFSKCRTMEMLDYKSRNEKAIEYIHNHQPVFELSNKKQIQEWFEKLYYIELLNILGGDEE